MTLPTLTDKALLVKLTQKSLGTTKRERQLTADLQEREKDAGLVVLSKLFTDKNNPVNGALKLCSELYHYHRTHTLPWQDGGSRLIPNSQYLNYTAGIASRRQVLDQWKQDHLPNYDSYVQSDIIHRAMSGKPRLTKDDYPTVDRLESALSPTVVFEPLPNQNHFLFDLSPEDIENFHLAQEERLSMAQADAVRRVMEPLEKLLQKLAVYTGSSEERFHASLVTNVTNGAQLSEELTLDGSNQWDEALHEVKTLTNGLSVDSLRENESYRQQTKEQLEKVMNQLAAFAPQ